MLIACGGLDTFNDKFTKECFGVKRESSGQVILFHAPPLADNLVFACHGSDGDRIALAGGENWTSKDISGQMQDSILVLDSIDGDWRRMAAPLGRPRSRAAGVLYGNKLLCLGGLEDNVGAGWVAEIALWAPLPNQMYMWIS